MSFQISSGVAALRLPAAVDKHRTLCLTFEAHVYARESIGETDLEVQDQKRKKGERYADGLQI